MADEIKENSYIKDEEVVINSTPIVKTFSKDCTKIEKITFPTDKGNITWRPTLDKETYRDGLTVVETKEMTFNDLPQLMKDIAMKIANEGKVKMLLSYMNMKVTKEGVQKSYNFITSLKAFEEWKII